MRNTRPEHWETCEAPICAGDRTDWWYDNVIWYPGESICGKTPYKKFQRVQSKINRLLKAGHLKYPDRVFTAKSLESYHAVGKGIKGGSPNVTGHTRGGLGRGGSATGDTAHRSH